MHYITECDSLMECGDWYYWVIPTTWGRIVSRRGFKYKHDARFYRNQAIKELRLTSVVLDGRTVYVYQGSLGKAAESAAQAFRDLVEVMNRTHLMNKGFKKYYANDWRGA